MERHGEAGELTRARRNFYLDPCEGTSWIRIADFEQIAWQVRNWRRWGEADQRGTLNHIDASVLVAASECVTQGKQFSLGLNFDKGGPQPGTRRFNPRLYVTDLYNALNPDEPNAVFSDDVVHMRLQAATQWDALGHVHYGGTLYNGCKACDALSVAGTRHAGIEHLTQPGIVSRGVLLDVARMKGVDVLLASYAISVADLVETEARQNVRVGKGDIALVRTGHIRRFTLERDRVAFNGPQPGVALECTLWLHERSAVAIAADNLAVEAIWPGMVHEAMPLPLHTAALRDMGRPLGELFDLEALAADCAQDGRYHFMLSAPPLAVTGAFGSPANPIASK